MQVLRKKTVEKVNFVRKEQIFLCEMLNNPNFNPIGFEGFRNQAGLNAVFINEGMPQPERLHKLNQIAIQQMTVLENAGRRNVLKV